MSARGGSDVAWVAAAMRTLRDTLADVGVENGLSVDDVARLSYVRGVIQAVILRLAPDDLDEGREVEP